ncbi:MAG: PAS domain-containing protein, partial [Anaerolineae bacterium]|nr:PAS domain-containing protein [Anaerolineae bacterium]
HKVQQILEDFKAGRRDVAEFWIQMQGMFVHIRYFALRDESGTYKGTIEVSQDLAPLRALEGERRLLDD